MRIISGKYKGKQLHPHKIFNARPTTDFAKESLFNVLNNYFFFDQIKVLDLFAGTGGIGLEFVSRGCQQVEMVEADQRNYKFIADTLHELNIQEVKLFKLDVFKFLKSSKKSYDIIFADPPYDMEDIMSLPEIIFERKMLNKEGWFILEHSKSYQFKNHPNFKEERSYGNVHFSIFLNNI